MDVPRQKEGINENAILGPDDPRGPTGASLYAQESQPDLPAVVTELRG